MQTFLRKYLSVTIVCFMLTVSFSLSAQDNADAPAVTLQTFYDQLAPYGQWVNYPNYGYVFIPSVAPGFTPYSTNGHWVYNDTYGWTWASDYPWGWATFHYGRWNYDAAYGWFWIPDLNWGPAWVAWRSCDGYYGWAPLPWGVSINVGFGGGYNISEDHWCFVPQDHLCELNLGDFFIPRTHNRAFIEHSSIIDRMDYDNGHRFGYFKGPDRVEVERYTHHPVEAVAADRYRRVPDHYQAPASERAVAQQRPVEEQRHDEQHNNQQAAERHDDNHDQRNNQRQASTPTHYVQYKDVPRRGRH